MADILINVKSSAQKGQAMLVTVLALSGTILGATTIAGLLMLYQIRQSTDAVNSAKAVFAADAGMEWGLYKFFKADGLTCQACPAGGACDMKPVMTNISNPPNPDDRVKMTCTQNADNSITIRSSGNALNTYRAFEVALKQ